MITIPASLIDRDDLTLIQRALLPLMIRHGFTWGEKFKPLGASFLAEHLRHSPKEVVHALDDLVTKKILKTVREKTADGVMILYALEPIQSIQNSAVSVAVATQYSDSNYYLNLSLETFQELHVYALQACDREGITRELFDDFNLYQRSENRRSFDWCAEFERWIRRSLASNAPALASASQIQESKPSSEQFEMAQYFIRRLSSVDPQFEEPFDVMSWARQIQYLIESENYSLLDVKAGIDWLFSAKGDWFRPNVPDAFHLRKHFKRIIGHTRSFRDGAAKLPDGINIFDIIGRA